MTRRGPSAVARPTLSGALAGAAALVLVASATAPLCAWSPQGHRLVALLAANHLTDAASRRVRDLLDGATLADVAVWADRYGADNSQTARWHYVNIPADAAGYDRDRDCPRQPGVSAGTSRDRWRDCVVDRIRYYRERLAEASLDRADRAVALKFLVHLVGDVHQPFHAIGLERGGNGIPVTVFGSPTCRYEDGTAYGCNLHNVWDTVLIAHRGLSDARYLSELERLAVQRAWRSGADGSPEAWAMESHALAKAALLPRHGQADEAYYRAQIPKVDERLARAGLRLAGLLNLALGGTAGGAVNSPRSQPRQTIPPAAPAARRGSRLR